MLDIEIRVAGIINSEWIEWFSEYTISYSEGNVSIIRGEVRDQSALYGLITKLRDLGLTLVSIKTMEKGSGSESEG